MTVGELIKQKRKKAKLTQDALAKKIGCATITIRQYESGKRSPSLRILATISDALDVDVFDLIPEEPEKVDRFSSLSEEQKEIVLDASRENEKAKALISIFIQLPDDLQIEILKKMKQLGKEAEDEQNAVNQKKDK